MKRIIFFGIVLAAAGLLTAAATRGPSMPVRVITARADGPDFDYTITLTNTSGAGNDNIATFWFGWVPGRRISSPPNPLSVTVPSGWTDVITHGGATDGYAIQFDRHASADAIAPGNSLVFGFTSADTPAELMGNSVFFRIFPVLTLSSIRRRRSGATASKSSSRFASVPEPSSLVLGIIGVVGLAHLATAPPWGQGLTRSTGGPPSGSDCVMGPTRKHDASGPHTFEPERRAASGAAEIESEPKALPRT